MSLASSPDFLFRPEDKALEALAAKDALTTSFDDYLNTLSEISDNGSDDKEPMQDSVDFSERDVSSATDNSTAPFGHFTRQNSTSPQPWREGLWCLSEKRIVLPGPVNQRAHSPVLFGKKTSHFHENPETTQSSRPYTNFSRPHPRYPPLASSQKETKRFDANPKTNGDRQSPGAHQVYSREVTLSPTLAYAKLQYNSKMGSQESWQQGLQNFHLNGREESVPVSPPLSGNLKQSKIFHQASASNLIQNTAIPTKLASLTSSENFQLPISSIESQNIPVDPSLSDCSFMPHTQNFGANPGLYPTNFQHDTSNEPMHAWPIEKFGSPVDQHPYNNIPVTSIPIHSPATQLLQKFAFPYEGGLRIQYPEIDQSVTLTPSHAFSAFSPPEPTYSYPPLPKLHTQIQTLSSPSQPPFQSVHHTFDDISPFPKPDHHRRQHANPTPAFCHLPFPTMSPTSIPRVPQTHASTSRSLRLSTSPTRSCPRRKSIGTSKSSAASHHPSHTRNLSSHHRHRSRSPPSGLSPHPSSATSTTKLTLDFVNFTSADSAKLLSDVAPSGSSKSRARREQEAREKRRRLSEAAVRAVHKAANGGKAGTREPERDVRDLENAILS